MSNHTANTMWHPLFEKYLESCGLTETYTTFYDECKSSGMLIPSHFKAEIESGVSLQDVETLLMHFDQENGDALLEVIALSGLH